MKRQAGTHRVRGVGCNRIEQAKHEGQEERVADEGQDDTVSAANVAHALAAVQQRACKHMHRPIRIRQGWRRGVLDRAFDVKDTSWVLYPTCEPVVDSLTGLLGASVQCRPIATQLGDTGMGQHTQQADHQAHGAP
jgi:uncharacterized protein YwlG (UPF0340 family)